MTSFLSEPPFTKVSESDSTRLSRIVRMQTISQNCKRLFNQCKAGGESDDSKIFFEQTVCRAIQNHLLLMNGNEENFCFRPLVPKIARGQNESKNVRRQIRSGISKYPIVDIWISWLFLLGEFHF